MNNKEKSLTLLAILIVMFSVGLFSEINQTQCLRTYVMTIDKILAGIGVLFLAIVPAFMLGIFYKK